MALCTDPKSQSCRPRQNVDRRTREPDVSSTAGVFFILSAIASVLGFVGDVARISALSMGVVIGGFLWTVAVLTLWRYLKKEASTV